MHLVIWSVRGFRIYGNGFNHVRTWLQGQLAVICTGMLLVLPSMSYVRAVPTVLSVPFNVTLLYGEPDQVIFLKLPMIDMTCWYVYGVVKITVSVPGK